MALVYMFTDVDGFVLHRNAYQLFHGNSSVTSLHYYSQNYMIVPHVHVQCRQVDLHNSYRSRNCALLGELI